MFSVGRLSSQGPARNHIVIEENLEVKLPTIWTNEAAEVGRKGERISQKRRSQRKSQKNDDQSTRKSAIKVLAPPAPQRSWNTLFFPMFCGAGGAKTAAAEPPGGMRDQKLHAILARSRIASQKCWNLTVSGIDISRDRGGVGAGDTVRDGDGDRDKERIRERERWVNRCK